MCYYIDYKGILSAYPITVDRPTATPEPTELLTECFTTEILDDGMMSITGYVGEETSFAIPIVINGVYVSEIADYAFASWGSLISIVIPWE